MSKTVKVTYNADTLKTTIVVDGKEFDTSRINGKEIADWAYPFMVRKVRWDGFYDEMVAALGGEKAFDLIFEGSDEALAELKEAWEDAPVNVVSGMQGNTVTIAYDANALKTEITVNGQPFDTSRISGKEIEDWVSPFMMRKIKWDGIFDELKAVLGTDEYEIQFLGTRAAMKVLMEDCPETVSIVTSHDNKSEVTEKPEGKYVICTETGIIIRAEGAADYYNGDQKCLRETLRSEIAAVLSKHPHEKYGFRFDTDFALRDSLIQESFVEGSVDQLLDAIWRIFENWDSPRCNFYRSDHDIPFNSFFKLTVEVSDQSGTVNNDKPATAIPSDTDKEAIELEEKASKLDEDNLYYESYQIRLKAAELGNVISISNLGWHFEFGNGVEQDYEKALKYYKQAADMGNAWSQRKTGIMFNNGFGCEMNEALAFSYFMKAAEQEDNEAQYWVGMCYKNGWGVSEDNEKAYSWFNKAHKNGSVDATRELGLCLWNGIGCQANKGRAKGLWNEAANKDDAGSANYLGEAHLEEENNNKAFFYFNKAYKLGFRDAAANLALCYEMGWGVQANYKKAVQILEENLENHPEYYVQLGKIFWPLSTSYQNYTKAAQYFQKAVEHEYVEGYYMLGICYSEGYGVAKNVEKGKELLQVAINNGHTDALEYLNGIEKREGYIDTAKKIGKGALGILGAIAQGYIQSAGSMYDDED